MEVVIPYKPRFPQNIIHPELEKHRFNVLVAHRRLGKSVLFINHTIKMAINNPLPNSRYAYIAPFLKQAKMIAWDYLKRYTKVIPGVSVNESELYVMLPNGAKIWLFGADNPDAMRGTYFDGAVLDEFAQFKPEVFGEIIRPALADRNGWCIFGGTPKGQNSFFEIYNKAYALMLEGDPHWWCGIYNVNDTRVIPESELELISQTLSDAQYRQEFLCDFSAAEDNVLITIDVVEKSANKTFNPSDLNGMPKVMGIDVARFGDDRCVIFNRQGLQAFTPKVFRKLDNMKFVGLITQEIEEFNPDTIFIDAGRGEGVIDRLRQLGYKVVEVNFGGSPTNGMYSNKRVEMWDKMREWMDQGGAIPNDLELKKDLVVPTYDFDSANRMRLESKDKIKERIGYSPDIADALALTFAFPVQSKVSGRGGEHSTIATKRVQQAIRNYDPFAR